VAARGEHNVLVRFVRPFRQRRIVRNVEQNLEFRLAVECCEGSFASSFSSSPELSAIDWAKFLRLASFHRIEGLAAARLANYEAKIPAEVRSELFDAASRIAAQNLRAAAGCAQLLEAFSAAEVPLLFLKGLAVGALAYRTPMLKMAVDIDLLIDPADLQRSAALLRHCGYQLVAPRAVPTDQGLLKWHRGWKESLWINPASQLQLDLHTRASDNPRLIPGILVHSARQVVDIGDSVSLPTFAPDEQFAYLAVHGSSAAWFRLKWISDLAGFLNGRSSADIDRLYHRSQELGAARAAGQALLLADEIFGTLKSSKNLRSELLNDRNTRQLWLAASKLLTGPPTEPTDRALGTFPIRRMQFSLDRRLRFKLSELSGQAHRIFNRP
jgi:hypothetical protein